jgi:hypothetical protein
MKEPFSFSVWTDVRPEPGQPDGRHRYAELLEEVQFADGRGFRAFCTPKARMETEPLA